MVETQLNAQARKLHTKIHHSLRRKNGKYRYESSLWIAADTFLHAIPDAGYAGSTSALLAILSGLALALHLECASCARTTNEVVSSTTLGQLLGLFLTVPLAGMSLIEEYQSFQVAEVLWLLLLGGVTGITYLTYAVAAPRLESTTTSTILLPEIVVATAAGYLILDETITTTVFLGITLLLSALYIRIVERVPLLTATRSRIRL